MVSNQNVLSYKAVDHGEISKFDIKFVFILLICESYELFLDAIIYSDGHPPLQIDFWR